MPGRSPGPASTTAKSSVLPLALCGAGRTGEDRIEKRTGNEMESSIMLGTLIMTVEKGYVVSLQRCKGVRGHFEKVQRSCNKEKKKQLF